jgi:hypothetical protein
VSPGSLRASDADRDSVAEVLNTAFAEGRISDEEHSERLLATLRAKTLDDLVPLTADLVPTPAYGPSPAAPGESVTGSQDSGRMTAALATVRRNGLWRVPRRNFANVFLGTLELDLTQAILESQVVELNVTQVLGHVFLRVPVGSTVRDETARVLGETSIKGIGTPDPQCPVIVLRGTNLLGDIKVRGPKRSLMWKRALT